MTDAIVVILSGNKATVYLYGSVDLDDFKLAWSDIDILGFQRSQNYWRKQYGAYHPHSRRIRQGSCYGHLCASEKRRHYLPETAKPLSASSSYHNNSASRRDNAGHRYDGPALFDWAHWSGDLTICHQLDHVVINDSLAVLAAIQRTVRAKFVDQSH